MKVVYRNHIELIREERIKKEARLVEQMLARGQKEEYGFLVRTNQSCCK